MLHICHKFKVFLRIEDYYLMKDVQFVIKETDFFILTDEWMMTVFKVSVSIG
jgi:hypothetical protein